MRVIFLDFDGVVVCPPNFRKPCPDRVALLSRLCAATGAVVVVSSTWRRGRSVEELGRILAEAGFTGRVVSATPILDAERYSGLWTARERGVEIAAWMSRAPVESYVVLDDDSDRGPIPEERWLICRFAEGLTEPIAGEACQALLRPVAAGERVAVDPGHTWPVPAAPPHHSLITDLEGSDSAGLRPGGAAGRGGA